MSATVDALKSARPDIVGQTDPLTIARIASEWALNIVDVGGTMPHAFDLGLDGQYQYFVNDQGGGQCGDFAMFLDAILHELDVNSFYLGIGNQNIFGGHVVTIVPYQGEFYFFDLLGGAYAVDANGDMVPWEAFVRQEYDHLVQMPMLRTVFGAPWLPGYDPVTNKTDISDNYGGNPSTEMAHYTTNNVPYSGHQHDILWASNDPTIYQFGEAVANGKVVSAVGWYHTGSRVDDNIYGLGESVWMYGGDGDDIITSGAGTDHMDGGNGADLFVFKPGDGTDFIEDFGVGDKIDLTAFANLHTLADLLLITTEDGDDAVINFGDGNTLQLRNVGRSTLTAEDFQLPPNTAPAITANGGGVTATLVFGENAIVMTTVLASDADPGATLAYTIAGGADQSLFQIDATSGVLALLGVPDFEAPTDADGDNSYVVTVQVSDGGLTDTQTITVTVTDVNDPPEIISTGGGAAPSTAGNEATAVVVAENVAAVTTVAAVDVDDASHLAYSIIGGADASHFYIDATTGALSFVIAPNSEQPADADADNNYIVQVRVSDGELTDDQTLTVMVADVYEFVPPLVVSGTSGGDFLVGADGDDMLAGFEGDDTMLGHGGNDTLAGGAGINFIDGGTGIDTLNYAGSTSAVGVNLAAGGSSNGHGGYDFFSRIENVTGSSFGDVLYGNTGRNVLDGGAASDTLVGFAGDDTFVGGAGTNFIDGGSGSDTLNYMGATSAVGVNLDTGGSLNGYGGYDFFSGIENITGSSFDDLFYGDAGHNVLDGGAGADTMSGGGGNDTFVLVRAKANGDVIEDFGAGDLLIFSGYGPGSGFMQISSTQWSINSSDGLVQDIITLSNGANLQAGGFLFV